MHPSAVELSILRGVRGWVCFMASRICLIGMQNYALPTIPPVAASAAEETTCFSVLHSMCIGVLSCLLSFLNKSNSHIYYALSVLLNTTCLNHNETPYRLYNILNMHLDM